MLSAAFLPSCRQRPEVKPQATQTPNGAIPDIQRVGAAVDLSKTDWINTADKGTGFLIVKNDSVLRSLAVALRNKTPEERKAWATQYGFLSMQQVYETAAQAGEKQQEFLQKFPNALRQDPQAGLLPNIHDYDLAHLVNPDGLIMVSGHLFQYSRQQVKRMDGKKGVKPALLKSSNNNDRVNGIEVHLVKNRLSQEEHRAFQRTIPLEYKRVRINRGQRGALHVGADLSTVVAAYLFVSMELNETQEPVYDYNNPLSICFGNCQIAIETAPIDNISINSQADDCVCYYYYPLIRINYRTTLNYVFQSEWELKNFFGQRFTDIVSRGHKKQLSFYYRINNGMYHSFNLGIFNDRGNIIGTAPLSFSGNIFEAIYEYPDAVKISGSFLFRNEYDINDLDTSETDYLDNITEIPVLIINNNSII